MNLEFLTVYKRVIKNRVVKGALYFANKTFYCIIN